MNRDVLAGLDAHVASFLATAHYELSPRTVARVKALAAAMPALDRVIQRFRCWRKDDAVLLWPRFVHDEDGFPCLTFFRYYNGTNDVVVVDASLAVLRDSLAAVLRCCFPGPPIVARVTAVMVSTICNTPMLFFVAANLRRRRHQRRNSLPQELVDFIYHTYYDGFLWS